MAAIITPTRPDPKYYIKIQQLADLTWSSEQMPLDDQTIGRDATGRGGLVVPGLRTLTANSLTGSAAGIINKYAPADIQRNALYTLSTTTSGTAHDNALATMNWVAAVNSYRDTQIANVKTLNFSQLQAYIVPGGIPPWPAPPSFLVPNP